MGNGVEGKQWYAVLQSNDDPSRVLVMAEDPNGGMQAVNCLHTKDGRLVLPPNAIVRDFGDIYWNLIACSAKGHTMHPIRADRVELLGFATGAGAVGYEREKDMRKFCETVEMVGGLKNTNPEALAALDMDTLRNLRGEYEKKLAAGDFVTEEKIFAPILGEANQVVADPFLFPSYITNRYGDFSVSRDLTADGALIQKLEAKYGFAFDINVPDDPRGFVGTSEMSFLAIQGGRLGILTEAVVELIEDRGGGDEEWRHAFADELRSPEEYARFVQIYREKIFSVREQFKHSQVFLADGPVTCDGRLTLCAFTPLVQTGELQYASPYDDPEAIDKLVDALYSVIDIPMPAIEMSSPGM